MLTAKSRQVQTSFQNLTIDSGLRRTILALLMIVFFGLLLRIVHTHILYGPTYQDHYDDDFTEYRIAAWEIINGDYSFSNSVYLIRPPLFPLLAAALGPRSFRVIPINLIIGTLIIPLTYVLARQFQLPKWACLLAAAIVACDPTSIRYSGVLLAEPLANIFLAASFVSLIALSRAESRTKTVFFGMLAGCLIALSSLTRPAAYLLWIPMAGWIYFARRRSMYRALAVVAFAASAAIPIGLWKHHNLVHFGNSNFSTIGSYNLLYFRANYVLFWINGRQDYDDGFIRLARHVQDRLGFDSDKVDVHWHGRHRAATNDVEKALIAIALEIFLQYPLEYMLTIPVGLYHTLFEVTKWPRWVGFAWNIPLLLAAMYGTWFVLRARRWVDAIFLVLPCIYFVAGTLLVQVHWIDTRARVMVTPLLAIMAAYGIIHLLNRRRAASASPSPPAGS